MRRSLQSIVFAVTVVVAAVAAAAAAKLKAEVAADAQAPAPSRRSAPRTTAARDNISRAQYVGPEACADCHDDNYQAWSRHPHRRMNALASASTVVGDFEHREVAMEGAVVRFDRRPEPPPSEGSSGGAAPPDVYTMTVERAGAFRTYRVTRTIGSRLKQFYAGVVTEGEPSGTNRIEDEVVLPFGYWITQKLWTPVSYFDPYGYDGEAGQNGIDPLHPTDTRLTSNCAYCHNTFAYLDRLGLERTALRGFSPAYLDVDPVGAREQLETRFDLGGLPGFPPGIQSRFDLERDLVTVGISCESCHFGARAHAIDGAPYRFGPSGPDIDLHPARPSESAARRKDNPWLINGICRQCHSSEGKFYPDGSSTENSREAVELDHGSCASAIACTDCHDPHVAGPPEEATADRPEQLGSCLRCHAKFADADVARGHARHSGAQATCLDCHMPRITHGVSRTVRSHRISTPGDPRMLAAAAPNACNGCHLDKSVRWTVDSLRAGWGLPLAADPSWAAAWGGSLDTPVRLAWAESPDEHVRLVLIEGLSRRDDAASMRQLLGLLDDRAGTVRAFASMAVGRRRGRWLQPDEVDVTALPDRRTSQIAALTRALLPDGAGRAK